MIEGVVIINRKGIIQATNNAITKLFGYTAEELIGENVKILMPSQYSKDHDSYIHNYNKTGQAKILDVGREVEGQNKNGDLFSLNLKVSKIDYEGEPYYMGVIHSLEKQKSSEAEIKNQTDLLERAEKIAHLGHWRVDLDDNKVFWSKEIYRIHGVDRKSFKPDLESAINFYHKEDIKRVRENLERAIENFTNLS